MSALIVPEPTWRRRIRLRWPQMVLLAGIGLYYVLTLGINFSVRNPGSANIIVFALVLCQVLFRADPAEEEPRRGLDWVCLTFPGRWKPSPFIGDVLSIALAVAVTALAFYCFPSAVIESRIGVVVASALMAFGFAVSLRRRTPRFRYVSVTEYNLACTMVDPALSLDQNVKRLQSYTWGEEQKTRDIARAALGLVPVTLPAISPYPR